MYLLFLVIQHCCCYNFCALTYVNFSLIFALIRSLQQQRSSSDNNNDNNNNNDDGDAGDLYFGYVTLSISKLLTVDNARRSVRTVVNNDGNAPLLSTQALKQQKPTQRNKKKNKTQQIFA